MEIEYCTVLQEKESRRGEEGKEAQGRRRKESQARVPGASGDHGKIILWGNPSVRHICGCQLTGDLQLHGAVFLATKAVSLSSSTANLPSVDFLGLTGIPLSEDIKSPVLVSVGEIGM